MEDSISKAEAKRRAGEKKYELFLEECNAADLSAMAKLDLVSCHGADLLGRRIVTIALGLTTWLGVSF